MEREERGRILLAFVSACVVGKNQNNPNWSSKADDAITQGGIGVWDLLCISVISPQPLILNSVKLLAYYHCHIINFALLQSA